MTPPPPKPTPPFDPPAIALIFLIFFGLTIAIGCISSDNNTSLPATSPTQQTTQFTTESTLSPIPIAESTIETTAADQTEIITEITTTSSLPTPEIETSPKVTTSIPTLPIDTTPTNYLAKSDWDKRISNKGEYSIAYPKGWVVYTGSGVSGYELQEETTLCYPRPAKSHYNNLRNIIEDVDYDIEIWGYDLTDYELNRIEYVKGHLYSALDYYKAKDIQEYRGTGKINGYDATHFTYTLSHVNTVTTGDAYIIKNGTKYYIIAYVGGKIESTDYDRTLILKIIQSYKPI